MEFLQLEKTLQTMSQETKKTKNQLKNQHLLKNVPLGKDFDSVISQDVDFHPPGTWL